MTKGICFYTDNLIEEPILSLVRNSLDVGLPIFSASLKPIFFGEDEIINGERGYPTMVKQILSCLERSNTKYVFFCEHDVLYHPSHFDFTPPRDDIFYYNENVWRWWIGADMAIRHDRMLSLSSLCVNREFALEHYRMRNRRIQERLGEFVGKEPDLGRKWGYEPGVKKKKRGGLTDDDFGTWSSEFPNIDIRHKGTFSRPKVKLSEFKHAPKWFKEIPISEIKGWDLKGMFSL
jgi:hypothetical protein